MGTQSEPFLSHFAYNIHSVRKVTTRTRLLDPKHAPDYGVGEVLTVKRKMAWQGLVTDKKRAIDPREIYEWLQPGTLVVLECTLRVLVRHGEIVSTSYIALFTQMTIFASQGPRDCSGRGSN